MIERGTGVFHLEQWLASRIHIPLRAFSPRKGLIFHNPVIKDGRERERGSRRDVSGNKVVRNYYWPVGVGASRAKRWTRVRSRVIKFTATPPVQCYRLTPTCATYDATTLPFHNSRQQRRTRTEPPSFPSPPPSNGSGINRRGTRA